MAKRIADLETGVIHEVVRFTTVKQAEAQASYKKRNKSKLEFNEELIGHYGYFYFLRYDKVIELLEDDTATAFRFLYLCTFGDRNGNIIAFDKHKCATYEDFTHIFEKTTATVKYYLGSMVENKLIYKESGYYKINPIYYSNSLDDDESKRNSIRTFKEAIKELYRNSNVREHALMGQIIKLVPYINIYKNILCFNIECADKDLIEPLSKNDIASILKPEGTYGYEMLDKLLKSYCKSEPVMGVFESGCEEHYVINPRLFYRGNKKEDLLSLVDAFDISKAQHERKLQKKRMQKNTTLSASHKS